MIIDVEGSELLVIEGAKKTISKVLKVVLKVIDTILKVLRTILKVLKNYFEGAKKYFEGAENYFEGAKNNFFHHSESPCAPRPPLTMLRRAAENWTAGCLGWPACN